ncbi:hypothetical protein EVB87_056 [Rhizobium phage RHph_N28_1]|nr:hypothetical protein EVB87_056 [Rhizobium phage RHph_N28_1]QIG74084.1 hypothetical protein EVC07_056 [Rhizobium phage RHph_N42]QXV73744.1 hypothetical protein [Rhizobium phage RHph_N46]
MHLDFNLPPINDGYTLTYGCASILDPADDTREIEDSTLFMLYFNPTLPMPFLVYRMGYHPDDAQDVLDEARMVSNHTLLFDAQTAFRNAIQERGIKLARKHGVGYDTDNSVRDATFARIDELKAHLSDPKANISLEDRNRLDRIEEGFAFFAGGHPRSTGKRANIEDVFSAFQQHQADCLRATKLGVAQMADAMKAAQDRMRDKFTEFGIARFIDWTDRDA